MMSNGHDPAGDLPSRISTGIAAKGILDEETEKASEVDWQPSTSSLC